MILVDANLLIYAVNRDSHHHRAARCWLEETLSNDTEVGFAWIVILAFLRITTHAGVYRCPLSPDQAIDYVDSWLRQPFVRIVVPAQGHWSVLRSLLRNAGTAANLTSDAHLAALAIALGAPVFSADNDFKRFAGIDHVNPLI